MTQTLLPIVLQAEEFAAFAVLIIILPIALILYLIIPSIEIYKLTKEESSTHRIISFSLYFVLLAVFLIVIGISPTLPRNGGIEIEFFRGILFLLLSLPITYPIGVWIIKFVRRRPT